MELNKNQSDIRNTIREIEFKIQKVIDEFCEQSNYEITYAEINAALINTLKSNNGFELRELCENKKNTNG